MLLIGGTADSRFSLVWAFFYANYIVGRINYTSAYAGPSKRIVQKGFVSCEVLLYNSALRLLGWTYLKRLWWVSPSWLGRQIVALEVEGSSPFTHPSFFWTRKRKRV